VFIDSQKAFDTVGHTILVHKLSKFCIDGTTPSWISNYLRARTQKVQVDGQISSPAKIDIGVPRGSILDPLLFLLYINNLGSILSNSKHHMYADDTVIFLESDKPLNSQKLMTDVLVKLNKWVINNKLSINLKNKYMIFGTQAMITKYKDFSLQIDNSEIERVNYFTYLGLALDEHPNWNQNMTTTS